MIALLWVAYFLNQTDRQVFNIVLPHIQNDLGTADSAMGFIAMCFNLCFAVTAAVSGYFGDRLSRRKIIVISVLTFSIAALLTGMAGGFFALIITRGLLTSAGQGMFGPTYPALIAEYHDSSTRARAMSIHQTSYYLGIILCGYLAGAVADALGWRYAFHIFGGAGILFALVLMFRLRDREKPEAAGPAEKVGFFEAMGTIFTVPTAICMIVGFTSLLFVLTGYLTWMPKYLMDRFALSGASAGFHSMFWTHIAAFFGVLIAGTISDRIAAGKGGSKNRLFVQAAGLLIGALFLLVMGLGNELVTVVVGLAGFGFFRAFFDVNTYAILYDVIPPRYYSSASAVLQLFGFGMSSLAPLILGLLSPKIGISTGIALLSVVWVFAAIVLVVARYFFFDKDAARIAAEKQF